jgi:Protein of unknown function (DUF3306)
MNDPEHFLSRWSRRKREASDEANRSPDLQIPHDAVEVPDAVQAPSDARPQEPARDFQAPEPVFDLSMLPTIESITAETDIRAFLAPGVPTELRLAALRRAWVVDPKVRDFVGLADYDWDFHTPGALPGFGPLTMTDELRREVARIVGGLHGSETASLPTPPTVPPGTDAGVSTGQSVASTLDPSIPNDPTELATDAPGASSDVPVQDQDELISGEAPPHRNRDFVAARQDQSSTDDLVTPAPRGHGRALPK